MLQFTCILKKKRGDYAMTDKQIIEQLRKEVKLLQKQLKSIVNCDDDLKAAIVYLSSYCNLTNEKISKLLNAVSNEKINICNGTTINTMKSFSAKSKAVLEKIKKEILKSPVINEDETPITVNGKINSTIGVFTKDLSLI